MKKPLIHTFKVDRLNPCDGSFVATSGTRDVGGVTEAVTGTLKGDQVAFNAIYTGSDYGSEIGYKWGTQSSGALGTSIPAWDSIGTPFSVTVTANLTDSTHYKNHGEYVKATGGGDDAAHSCIGMPVGSGR
jgi:hypothetical protein